MLIRKTRLDDVSRVLEIYSIARKYMKDTNNPNQWGDDWPSKEILLEDIEKGQGYVLVDDNNVVQATFAYIEGIDKTYLHIEQGKWLSDEPYATIHRLASSMEVKGSFKYIMDFMLSKHINLRADTHKDNKTMIHLLEKNGFIYCGLIEPIEGGIRVAYERIKE